LAGDGTTTATVLAQPSCAKAPSRFAAGMNPMDLKARHRHRRRPPVVKIRESAPSRQLVG